LWTSALRFAFFFHDSMAFARLEIHNLADEWPAKGQRVRGRFHAKLLKLLGGEVAEWFKAPVC